MANLVCSLCGKNSHYSASRGSKLADLSSPCCHASPAKGIMIDIEDNNIHDEYATRKQKIFFVNNRIQITGYPKGIDFLRNDGESTWFVDPEGRTFRPSYIPDEWIQYYKIKNSILEKIGYVQQIESGL